MHHTVKINDLTIGTDCPLALFAGPCVIENYEHAWEIASFLKALTHKLDIPFGKFFYQMDSRVADKQTQHISYHRMKRPEIKRNALYYKNAREY